MRDQRRTHTIYVPQKAIEAMSAPWGIYASTLIRRTGNGKKPPKTAEYVRRDVVDKAIRAARRNARRKATRT